MSGGHGGHAEDPLKTNLRKPRRRPTQEQQKTFLKEKVDPVTKKLREELKTIQNETWNEVWRRVLMDSLRPANDNAHHDEHGEHGEHGEGDKKEAHADESHDENKHDSEHGEKHHSEHEEKHEETGHKKDETDKKPSEHSEKSHDESKKKKDPFKDRSDEVAKAVLEKLDEAA